MEYYTNVQVYGSRILYRGIKNGKRFRRRVTYNPSLFMPSKDGEYQDIHGNPLRIVKKGSPKDCRKFADEVKNTQGSNLFGMSRYEYQFIGDHSEDHIDWNIDDISIMYIDIEVASEGGFASPEKPTQEIVTISLKVDSHVLVLGMKDFETDRDDVTYIKCTNEAELLSIFMRVWTTEYPDVVTGWYIKQFDMPYLIRRIARVLGDDISQQISPWKRIYEREWMEMGQRQTAFVIQGVAQLDYIDLYKKFTLQGKSQENYRLDNIANVELGERKIDYTEYKSLDGLYNNNYQLFVEYNIHDVELVEMFEDKLKLIELALTLAYDAKVNYEDVFMQVRMWTVLVYNKLMERNIVIPYEVHNNKIPYIGAYVKEPVAGMYDWVASFDLTSLYPHLIMQYNISPDTFIEPRDYPDELAEALGKSRVSIESLLREEPKLTPLLKKYNVTMTPNKQLFRTDIRGFLAEMMEEMFADRKRYKGLMLDAAKKLQTETDPEEKKKLEKLKARYNNLQSSKKVCLNSAYGALGNEFFIYFDVRQAEGITSAGQLSIRWIGDRINIFMNKLCKTESEDYIIASDTDSIYLRMDKLIEMRGMETSIEDNIRVMDDMCEKILQPFIERTYQKLADYMNAYDQKMFMKREVLANRGLWTRKKRYILNVYNSEGVQYKEPEIKISGLEAVRSSTPTVCRTKIKEAIKIIMQEDERSLQRFIKKFRNEYENVPLEDIASPRSVNNIYAVRPPGVGLPIQVSGAKAYNKILEKEKLEKKYEPIRDGEKIKFVYLKKPNPYYSHVMAFPNFLPEEIEDVKDWVDYKYQFRKTFLTPLQSITNVIGWHIKKKKTLKGIIDNAS